VCNDFERDIIITLAHIAPEPLFFYGKYKSIELPEPCTAESQLMDSRSSVGVYDKSAPHGTTKFRPYSKLPKKTLNNLKADAAPIFPGEESTNEEDKLETINNIGSLI
jgi:hypothetical protein